MRSSLSQVKQRVLEEEVRRGRVDGGECSFCGVCDFRFRGCSLCGFLIVAMDVVMMI